MEATEGIFEKIRPPRIEDAGLEDCALPPESIKEAFLKAASAVRSSLVSDDEDDATCVDDPWPSAGESSDAIVGILPENEAPGSCVGKKGGKVPERLGDKVVDGVGDDDVAKGDEVVGGGEVSEEGECCVEELKGLKIGEKTEKKDDANESDRPILTEGYA
ncbi:Mucin-5AC like [Heracleum sosnowskyi]|uniref:Mucin-5AC like n=1 Tax=Heracleum sosnowskyi TaxID=360622 RepID=A0AAD8M8D2_9APIA|nr:Mucin-5AC like [Heracleum sosnowskyi]